MVVDDSRARDELRALGFRDEDARAVRDDERDLAVGRVARLDRGWSTVMTSRAGDPLRVRNVGVDVAVGDWVVVTADEIGRAHV